VTATIEWLGTATFRLRIGGLTIFLDTYMDRVPEAPPVGLASADVTAADSILVGHSHFDHIAGADTIALNTGARVIGSHESCRVLRERGVPDGQLLAAAGGERFQLGPGVTVRVFPSVHSCTWILTDVPAGMKETGHTGLTQDERAAQPGLTQAIFKLAGTPAGQVILGHIQSCAGSLSDGGPLVYLIETDEGSIFWQDSSGCWTGVLRGLRADTAILAAAGRANVDGEPVQGSMADFLAMEAEMLGARTVLIGHHDDWMPPVTQPDFDIGAVKDELGRRSPGTVLLTPSYLEAVPLFRG
jgi:L-ascorbate metabolism protein UlaG (beta-lactamase superfamily)